MQSVLDLIGERATRTPGAPAVASLDFGDWRALAAGLAARLRRQGVRPGDRVGLDLGTPEESAVGLLGILWAGGVCVPLPPAPAARRRFLAADAELWALGKPGSAPAERVDPGAPALLLYGPGPRAAVRSHANLAAEVRALACLVEPREGERWAVGPSPSAWLAAAAGGACLVPFPRRWSPGWLEDEGVAILQAGPGLLPLFSGRPHPGVRLVLVEGPPWQAGPGEALRAAFPQARLLGLYAPRETGPLALMEGAEEAPPLGEVELAVRDAAGQPAAEGELWVRGPSVAPGWWARPRRTARDFRDGWFRTGDLVRQGPGGGLRFLGRRDRRVWVGDEPVEPAEVEAALRSHPGVREAAVVGVGGELRAFVAGEGLDGFDLRRHLVRRLPAAWLPRRLEIRADLPRTASGRVDRRALRRG